MSRDRVVRLANWFVTADPFQAPEVRMPVLHGEVHGHPRFDDGHKVTIGTVQEINGRVLKTKRTTYRLGRVKRDYREHLRRHSIPYDPREPVKWGKRSMRREADHD